MKWFAGALLLLIVAVVFDLGLLAYAMYALLGVMVASRVVARSWSENLTATRDYSRGAVNIGDTVAVVVKVKNTGLLPVAWMLLEDLLPRHALLHSPPNLLVTGRRLQLAMLKSFGRKTLFYQLKCNRRGYYQIGPLMLETGDLFGLHRRHRVLSEPHFLLVYPKVIPLTGFDITSRRPIGEVRMTHRLYEDPTRIAGVRRYEAGDPLSRIHWHATARTGHLHSKIYEPSTVAGVTILLDFHKTSLNPSNEPFRSELAVTAAASLAGAVYDMGQQVGLVTNARDAADRIQQEGWDRDVIRSRAVARQRAEMRETSDRLRPLVVETRRGAEQLMRILAALARAEVTDGLTFAQLIGETTSRLPRDASVVAILTSVTTETAIALGNLRRRGFAVTAILNVYENFDFAEASGPLLAEGVETRQLRDESQIPSVCQQHVIR